MKIAAGAVALLTAAPWNVAARLVYGNPTATVDGGVIVGTTTRVIGATAAINKFLGIPFAEAPVGSKRFAVPKPTTWSKQIDTKAFKPACIQAFRPIEDRNFIQDVFSIPRPEESEDCLYLNVFAPKKSWKPYFRKPRYPVLYWIYGGGFNFGNAGQPIYDGSHFAALENVILVSVNYRTNVFGFPIAPDIANLTERNLGLLDQRAGLDWVQRNIHAFGGDPKRVTIFGQSAGGYAVDVLLTSPWPNGPPFRAGIMESGTYSYNPLSNCNNTNFASWNNLLDHLNCTNTTSPFTCVMDTPAADIRYAQEKFNIGFGMAGDNVTIVCDPRLRREAGRFARVPVIGGSTVEDGSYYAAKNGTDIDRYFKTVFPNETALKTKILDAYSLNPAEGRFDNQSILAQIHTDWNFHCPAVFLSNSSTRYVPTYRYLFNATFPNARLSNLPDNRWPVPAQLAYHSSEIPIVFSTYNLTGATREQKRLSETMRRAWAAFARDPSRAPIRGWKVAGKEGATVMDFGSDGKAGFRLGRDTTGKCEAWKDFIWNKHY
ncbi:alpha/beta-hydrolase [Paraphaeosphaeria sporulosa]|uniref:Carboxylic ester hydrolase n=1 Tax=Paraphaeosphaeria sporulosa TaxID=1460663 RepID=A0A177CH16_9PLEO|nr:alpha/beta-hydrolase [Paraphaeosphaeria sporulosa]OAG05997.1 alpha/beta-hydrolase [Paraphaeosphaeria sporulosa]